MVTVKISIYLKRFIVFLFKVRLYSVDKKNMIDEMLRVTDNYVT